MTTGPNIVAFKLTGAEPGAGEGWSTLATMTVEHGPFLIAGVRLVRREDGRLYLHPPRMKARTERIAILPSPERSALLGEATNMLRAFTKARSAELPVATAPQQESHDDELA